MGFLTKAIVYYETKHDFNEAKGSWIWFNNKFMQSSLRLPYNFIFAFYDWAYKIQSSCHTSYTRVTTLSTTAALEKQHRELTY